MDDKINGLCQMLSELVSAEVEQMPTATLMRWLQTLRPASCQLQALQHRLVAAVDANATTDSRRSASTASWLRNALHVRNATSMVRSAAALPRLPSTAAAFAAGEISDAHVASIASVTASMSTETLSAGVEELLVSEARRLAPSKFASAAVTIRDRVVPPGERPDSRPRHPDRFLRVRQRADGRMSMSAMFDGPTGRDLIARLDDVARASCTDDGLSLPTRRADAMVSVVLETDRVRDDRTGTAEQHVGVAVDADLGAVVSTDPSLGSTRSVQNRDANVDKPTRDRPAAPEGPATSSTRKARRHRSRQRRKHPSAQGPVKR